MGLFDIFTGDTQEKYEYNTKLQEIPIKSEEIFKKCYKLNEYATDLTNIGITEVIYSIIFAVEVLADAKGTKLSGNAKKALLNIAVKDILKRMHNDFNFLTKWELGQINMVRQTYYKATLNKFCIPNNMISRSEWNSEKECMEDLFESPVISAIRGVLFFYYVDYMLLNNEKMPLAHGVDLNNYGFYVEECYRNHTGYESQKIADLIFNYAKDLADEIILIAKTPVR